MTSIDNYISQFPEEVQILLNEIRKVIKEAAPEATERLVIKCLPFIYMVI